MPQFNPETENGLLGACLKNVKVFESVKDMLTEKDFYYYTNGHIWRAMKSLDERGLGVDTITVGDELDRMGLLQEISTQPTNQFVGRTALSWIRDNGSPQHAKSYAAEVLDYSAKRELEAICTQAVNWSQNGRNAQDIMGDLVKRMGDVKIYNAKTVQHTKDLSQSLSEAYDHTFRAAAGEIVTIKTGLKDLDETLDGGLTAPDLLIIAGRPGQGKTALMVTIAKNAAKDGKKVVFFTLEMQNKQIAMRLVTMETGLSYGKQKNGRFTEQEWQIYTEAVGDLSSGKYNIILNDLSAISPNQMRNALRNMGEFDLIIVDYIQLQESDSKYENRVNQLSEITRGLKSIAKEFNVPVLAGAQLSRAVEQRADKRPILSDLRESGSLEQDADVVFFIHRPDEKNENQVELIAAKNRNGARGVVDLYFNAVKMQFANGTSRVETFGN